MNHHPSSCLLDLDTSKPGGSLVLLIEDDSKLAEEIRVDLEAGGHMVHVAATLAEGLRAARSGEVAALVIDRFLEGENGLSIVEALRGEGKWIPTVAISENASVDERIAGLKAGCDDYLVKPFDVRELSARVDALLRRNGDMGVIRLRVGDLEMDLIDRSQYEGKLIDLVPMEFKLLEYFMRRPGQAVSRRCCSRTSGIFSPPLTPMSSTCRSAICAASSTRPASGGSLSLSGRSASS